jgi:hypothetical protein
VFSLPAIMAAAISLIELGMAALNASTAAEWTSYCFCP